MFNFLKKKESKDPVSDYEFKFQVCYRTAKGVDRCTGVISITIPAVSESEAKDKLNDFVKRKSRVDIKSMKKVNK